MGSFPVFKVPKIRENKRGKGVLPMERLLLHINISRANTCKNEYFIVDEILCFLTFEVSMGKVPGNFGKLPKLSENKRGNGNRHNVTSNRTSIIEETCV